MSTLGSDQHVLVTGANGFVASHILALLLKSNVRITGTVRSQDKVDAILETHPLWKDRVDFVLVPDFTSAEPFNAILKNAKVPFTHAIHTASPLDFTMTDIYKDMIEPAVKGTTEILRSAHHYGGPNLKRVVVLGSAVCVLNSLEDLTQEGRPYTENDWNPSINESNRFGIADFINGNYKNIEDVKFIAYHFVDVRDVARAHVEALMNPAAGGKRIVLVSELFTPQLVANVIRKNFPNLRDRVSEGNPSQILPPGVHPTGWSLERSLYILEQGATEGKWDYIGLEKSIIYTVKSMLEQRVL
ncbi:NAD dependent epimerase/dehydratase [Trichoderma chlorosporum]